MGNECTRSGNKGEWSEVYVFFRLLGEHVICSCDERLERTNQCYPLLKIERGKGKNSVLTYTYVEETDEWLVTDGLAKVTMVTSEESAKEADELLELIRCETKRTVEYPKVYKFLQRLGCDSIKAESTNKKDITLQICDIRAGHNPTCGFSIKSYLGKAPTLLNSSGECTNFLYEVRGLTVAEVVSLNSIEKTKDLMMALRNRGATLHFVDCCSDVFRKNLRYIDSSAVNILGEMVRLYYCEDKKTIESAIETLAEADPLHYEECGPYREMVKRLLMAVALGMTPGKPWDGKTEVTSGFIVVKPDGDVVTYHVYNRDAFMQYLYLCTRFEKPSRSRHHYARLFEVDGKIYIKLALQIRFR